jgi:hypothetical protein
LFDIDIYHRLFAGLSVRAILVFGMRIARHFPVATIVADGSFIFLILIIKKHDGFLCLSVDCDCKSFNCTKCGT